MTRGEFLDTLRMQLQGELSPSQIEGHLHYYNEYILEAVAAGRTESEVLEELGSPVFIAKTLLDTAESVQDGYESREQYSTGSFYDGAEEPYREDMKEGPYRTKMHMFHINSAVAKWVIPLVLIVIIFLVLSLVGSVIALAIRFFVPILLVILVINFFRSRDERWRR